MNQSPLPSIATYTERLPQVQRVFRLYQDHVEIQAKWTIGKEYQASVKLADLKPQVQRFFVRNRWFKRSILIGSLAVAAAVVFTQGDYPEWLQRNVQFCWAIAAGCGGMACVTFRRQQFARFARRDGQPGLDVCSAGPDRARFDEFVEQLRNRIPRSQTLAGVSGHRTY
ncbi:MAG: hypothetical protein NTY19_42705 [Planctomycetota bacterium]|nr:hypothetical protein [Planctomycetota bacterium]